MGKGTEMEQKLDGQADLFATDEEEKLRKRELVGSAGRVVSVIAVCFS